MQRIAIGLAVFGILLGIPLSAQAGWVWRNGRWSYVDPDQGPPPPSDTPPKTPPAPIAPTPKPDGPEPPVVVPPAPPVEPKPPAEPQQPAPPTEPAEPEEPRWNWRWWQRKPAPQQPETPAQPDQPAEPKKSWWNWRWWERQDDPNPDKTLLEQARAARDAGRYRSADGTLKKLIKNYPASSFREEAIWMRATLLFDRGEYYKAFEEYESLLTQYAGSARYRDALLKEIEIAELFLGPTRRRVLGVPVLSGETEAIAILRRAYEHQPAGDLADDVVLRIADYYWSKHKWPEAEDYYDKYCREYPNGDAILQAELQRARCAIERCRGPRYDVTSLRLAYDRLRQFQKKFPEEGQRQGVPALIAEVRDRQAQSLYEIAARYHRAREPLAAAFYAERLCERFPDSPWTAKAEEFLTPSTLTGTPAEPTGEEESTP
ncbi:MAG TPA: outer membrane protein assembly factor BamD [Phycisphaerae bacterium]|nr:outer membrane protein assembly factor BamD [Phycisphaerae bacterium]